MCTSISCIILSSSSLSINILLLYDLDKKVSSSTHYEVSSCVCGCGCGYECLYVWVCVAVCMCVYYNRFLGDGSICLESKGENLYFQPNLMAWEVVKVLWGEKIVVFCNLSSYLVLVLSCFVNHKSGFSLIWL